MSPIVVNLYMEEIESIAPGSFKGTTQSHWFRYVDDIRIKNKTQEVEVLTEHLNSFYSGIKSTRENMKENRLPFLDCAKHFEKDGGSTLKSTGNY